MARNARSISPELQAANDAFGRAFCTWRTQNGLSQQDPHNWSRDVKPKGFVYNSQLAYLESGNLDPKAQFWLSLAVFNNEISTQGKKGFRYVVKESTRERLQNAAPFLNNKNEVATAGDFFEMYCGLQPVNSLYVQKPKEPLTDEFCNQYGKTLEKAFNEIAREHVLSNKDAWEKLKATNGFPQSEEYLHVCQDLLRGEHDLTKEETVAIAGEHKRCPCKDALTELAGHPIDYLEEASEELFEKL